MPPCLPVNQTNWSAIRALRAPAQRRLWEALPPRISGWTNWRSALLGRIIGCLLGVPVEGLSVESMRAWSEYIGKPFPPVSIGKKCKIRSFGTATAVSAANTGNARSGPLR
ncbi:MAG: ADP-ribosylglycohydrolase family protein [Ruthenibacterium lactatiformans]